MLGADARAALDDWRTAPIDERLRATLGFLRKMTLEPEHLGPADAEALRAAGVTDAAIEEAIEVAFLFNVAPLPGPGGVDVNGALERGVLTNPDIIDGACGVAVNNIASLLAAIRDGIIYVNVHSEGNPPGEVRGQIFARVGRDDSDKDRDHD